MPFLGHVLVACGGALSIWASTCFFAPPPRGNPTRQGERLELAPGARWEFDLGGWDEALGVPMLALGSDAKESARVEVRVEREGIEPRTQAFELEDQYVIAAVPPVRVALELTAYDGPPASGRVYVWEDDLDRSVGWSIGRSGGMFGLLLAALLVGLGLLLIWRRPKPSADGSARQARSNWARWTCRATTRWSTPASPRGRRRIRRTISTSMFWLSAAMRVRRSPRLAQKPSAILSATSTALEPLSA